MGGMSMSLRLWESLHTRAGEAVKVMFLWEWPLIDQNSTCLEAQQGIKGEESDHPLSHTHFQESHTELLSSPPNLQVFVLDIDYIYYKNVSYFVHIGSSHVPWTVTSE